VKDTTVVMPQASLLPTHTVCHAKKKVLATPSEIKGVESDAVSLVLLSKLPHEKTTHLIKIYDAGRLDN
jgi:hypothetical protein